MRPHTNRTKKLIFIVFLFQLISWGFFSAPGYCGGPPPPPANGMSTQGSGQDFKRKPPPTAPLGGGLEIIMALGLLYTGKKVYSSKTFSKEEA